MTTWVEFADAAPDLANRSRARFEAHGLGELGLVDLTEVSMIAPAKYPFLRQGRAVCTTPSSQER